MLPTLELLHATWGLFLFEEEVPVRESCNLVPGGQVDQKIEKCVRPNSVLIFPIIWQTRRPKVYMLNSPPLGE